MRMQTPADFNVNQRVLTTPEAFGGYLWGTRPRKVLNRLIQRLLAPHTSECFLLTHFCLSNQTKDLQTVQEKATSPNGLR